MKKFLSILLISVMVVSLSACTSPQSEEPDTTPTEDQADNSSKDDDLAVPEDNDVEAPNTDVDEEIEEEEKEKEVNLYFSNNEYIETGNESLEKLKLEKRTIDYENMILEEAVVRELLKGPEDKVNLSSSIPENVSILEIKVVDDTAYVDFSSENLSGSSMQESFTISQIVESLLDLNTVKKVQFLIDGEKANSLMGHVEIDKPFPLDE